MERQGPAARPFSQGLHAFEGFFRRALERVVRDYYRRAIPEFKDKGHMRTPAGPVLARCDDIIGSGVRQISTMTSPPEKRQAILR